MNKVFWFLTVPLYFASRLINLTLIPIFTDEAIYLRWSQIMAGDWKYLYLPLTDGKPPLFMWLTGVAMKLLPLSDPLFVGRLVSVSAGFFAPLGMYFTTRQLFSDRRIAYFAVILYLVCPFTFFYDRFALADSLLAMWGIWSLGLGILLVKTLSIRVAVILGLVLGFGWLTKTPAEFFIILLPILVFLQPKNWIKYGGLVVIAAVIARIIYSTIFLLPQAYVINLKSYEFIISFPEFLKNPLQFFAGNLRALSLWEAQYLTWPMVVLIITGLIKISRQKIILLSYFLSLFIFMVFFNKVIYPRFLLVFTPMLLILAAATVADFKKLAPVVLAAVLILPIFTDIKLFTNPVSAPIADTDSNQYLNSWSAGFGVKELNNYFTNKKTTVGVEGTFGLMPYGLELYQKEHPDLVVKPYWPMPEVLPKGLDYFVVYQHAAVPSGWQVSLVAKYQEGSGNDYLKLYKIEQ